MLRYKYGITQGFKVVVAGCEYCEEQNLINLPLLSFCALLEVERKLLFRHNSHKTGLTGVTRISDLATHSTNLCFSQIRTVFKILRLNPKSDIDCSRFLFLTIVP